MRFSHTGVVLRLRGQVRTTICFALTLGLFLVGCRSLERSQTCSAIEGVTRVTISRATPAGPVSDLVITDPERIRQLVAFANAYRDCKRPWDTMPAPRLTASFYEKENFKGAIGVGTNFFYVSCPNWKGIRTATAAEIEDFNKLIEAAR
jgi:hypothetical protein